MKPVLIEHGGVGVVRDDLLPGGTKARFFAALRGRGEIVYASPACGGAQTALASVLGDKATIFTAARKQPHPRTLMAQRLGAKIVAVKCGYLSVVQARARAYAEEQGALLLPFGADMPEAIEKIAEAARSLRIAPDEVWCAAGSGTLSRALQLAWPGAAHHVVQVGREVDLPNAIVHKYPLTFEKHAKIVPPFPSDPHYDAKAWEVCTQNKGKGLVVMWNVTGPAQ